MTPREIHEKISEMAYLMWEAAGRQQGLTMEYWLAAERQVMAMVEAAVGQMMPASRAPAQALPPGTAGTKPAPEPAVQASPAEPALAEPATAEPVAAEAAPTAEKTPAPGPADPEPASAIEEEPASPPNGGAVEHKTRPIVRKDWIGQNVTLDLDTSNGHFMVPHDELWGFVQAHKTVATTKTWQEKGEYSWPKIPHDLLEFLSTYRRD